MCLSISFFGLSAAFSLLLSLARAFRRLRVVGDTLRDLFGGMPLNFVLSEMVKPRNYAKEYRDYHGKPEQIKARNSRNAARAKLKAAGVNVAGKDVDHKNHNPRDNRLCNLRVRSISANRADNKHKSKK